MTLPYAPASISASQISAEFGGGRALSSWYRGGYYVPYTSQMRSGNTDSIPTGGTISYSQFRGVTLGLPNNTTSQEANSWSYDAYQQNYDKTSDTYSYGYYASGYGYPLTTNPFLGPNFYVQRVKGQAYPLALCYNDGRSPQFALTNPFARNVLYAIYVTAFYRSHATFRDIIYLGPGADIEIINFVSGANFNRDSGTYESYYGIKYLTFTINAFIGAKATMYLQHRQLSYHNGDYNYSRGGRSSTTDPSGTYAVSAVANYFY